MAAAEAGMRQRLATEAGIYDRSIQPPRCAERHGGHRAGTCGRGVGAKTGSCLLRRRSSTLMPW